MAASSKATRLAEPAAKSNIQPELSFESAMDRLAKIVEEMESAQMPLDELLAGYEEGSRLITLCQEKLQAAEQRVEIVNRKIAASDILTLHPPLPDLNQPSHPDVSLF